MDLIDRQATIDALEKVARLFPYRVPGNRDTYDRYNESWNDAIGRAEIENEELPSAQPERTGRWILDENDFLTKCSECGCHPWFGVIPTAKEATKKMPHCPRCLAKMEGER